MKKRTTTQKLKILLLICAVLVTMLAVTVPAYAAGGTITITYDPDVDGLNTTNFTLYKVGGYDRDADGKSILKLNDGFDQKIEVNYPAPGKDATDEEIAAWQENWLGSADAVYQNLLTMDPKPEALATAAWTNGMPGVTFTAPENGLYLVVGDVQKVGDYYWWPVPVLIQVLNGDATFDITAKAELKMDSTPVTYTHSVKKVWSEGHNAARPDSVDVDIIYGDTKEVYFKKTVTLDESNGWTYTWQSKEDGTTKSFIDKDGKETKFEAPVKLPWTVKEVAEGDLAKYFISEVSKPEVIDEITDSYTITNTFGMDELVINKTMNNFLKAAEGASTSVVFDITGYQNGEAVYHTQRGLSFSGPGSDSLTISNLPLGLDKIEVKEIYSPNYTPDKATKVYTIEPDKSDFGYTVVDNEDGTSKRVYSVSFTNTWNEGTEYNTGIVNKYELKDGSYKIVDRQGLKPVEQ